VLTIATTHTQARYSLPTVIKSFRAVPEVRLELIQGTPQEIETLLHNGGADIGIASERLSNDSTLAAFPGSAGTTACWSLKIIPYCKPLLLRLKRSAVGR
jgi:DNA-binding transcriptional LysR family regulator